MLILILIHVNRFLNSLFVSIDANFRLKRKKISTDEIDPGLGHGIAYMVEETAFKHHLGRYAGETELVQSSDSSVLS